MIRKYLLILLFILTSQYLFANAGSPILWFSFLHLIIINALIGISESWILTKMTIENNMGRIIAGNYVSMFIGMYVIVPLLTYKIGYHDFWGNQSNYGNYNLNGFFVGMLIAFISTLLIEFPFYYWGINKDKRSKIIEGLIIANLITYFIMTMIYYLIVKGGGHF